MWGARIANIRYGQGLRGPPAPLGRRAHTGMAQPQPPPRQGLRADHRLGNRMVVHRLDPALRPPHRKALQSNRIIMNQALIDGLLGADHSYWNVLSRSLCYIIMIIKLR